MFDITGKRILLTGATGGIGKRILETLHNLGVVITISGTRKEVLADLQSQFQGIHVIRADLADRQEVEGLAIKAQEKMGGIDGLICNSGITNDQLLVRMSNYAWDDVININLTSTFILNRNVAKIMFRQKKGRIINISSIVGSIGNQGQANYAASKAGVDGMTKSIALELANRNITANCIAPGFIKTPMTDKLAEVRKSKIIESIPMKRVGEPKDVAYAVVFLMSDEASYITGQVLHINGGMY